MKPSLLSPTARRSRTTSAQRQRLLAEFDRSGLSAPAFAREHPRPVKFGLAGVVTLSRFAVVDFRP
ncbi:MAG: hypothetical protein HY299_18535 [Verrucomicrobia bacterium]|nr:hypothetical protein [Verrucomicrobiota bacterium]